MKIILTQIEQEIAKYIAKARYIKSRGQGVSNQKIGPQSNEETDLEGVAAEIAFCKIMNIYPLMEVGDYKERDCYTVEMGSVDVKTTKYKSGHLVARVKERDREPDSYALMIGEFPEYRFVGWLDARTLKRKENIKDFGHGPTYAAEQKDLFKP